MLTDREKELNELRDKLTSLKNEEVPLKMLGRRLAALYKQYGHWEIKGRGRRPALYHEYLEAGHAIDNGTAYEEEEGEEEAPKRRRVSPRGVCPLMFLLFVYLLHMLTCIYMKVQVVEEEPPCNHQLSCVSVFFSICAYWIMTMLI